VLVANLLDTITRHHYDHIFLIRSFNFPAIQ